MLVFLVYLKCQIFSNFKYECLTKDRFYKFNIGWNMPQKL